MRIFGPCECVYVCMYVCVSIIFPVDDGAPTTNQFSFHGSGQLLASDCNADNRRAKYSEAPQVNQMNNFFYIHIISRLDNSWILVVTLATKYYRLYCIPHKIIISMLLP